MSSPRAGQTKARRFPARSLGGKLNSRFKSPAAGEYEGNSNEARSYMFGVAFEGRKFCL